MGTGDRMTNWETCPAVESVPGRLSGAWVFKGTRVPLSSLFGNLADGATVREYLAWFPGVEEWHVKAVLEHEIKSLDARVEHENPVDHGPLPLRDGPGEIVADEANIVSGDLDAEEQEILEKFEKGELRRAAGTEDEMRQLAKLQTRGGDAMNYVEQLIERGRREGRPQAMMEWQVRTIERLVVRDVPWSTIEAATGIDEAAFRKLKQQLDATDDGSGNVNSMS